MRDNIKAIAAIALFVGSLWIIVALSGRREAEREILRMNETKALRDSIQELQRDNAYLEIFRQRMNDLDERIAAVRERGYKPDRLVMRYLQKKSEELSVPMDSIVAFIERETSWANRKGMIGEVGYTQVRPETIETYLKSYGIIPQNFDPNDYADFKTGLDWTYYMAIEMRINKGKISWANWNRNGGL